MGHVAQLTPKPSQIEPSFNLLPGLEASPFKITPVEPDKYAMVTEFKSLEELNEDEKYAVGTYQQIDLEGNQLQNLVPPSRQTSTNPTPSNEGCRIS